MNYITQKCEDCVHRPDNLFWATHCKKEIVTKKDGEIKIENVELCDNKDFNYCIHYSPSFWRLLKTLFGVD